MLVDLHDEYARHVGHADLFREAVDGLVGEDPPGQKLDLDLSGGLELMNRTDSCQGRSACLT